MSDKYEYSAAIPQKDGTFRLVGVSYGEDDYVDALGRVLDHYYAWKHDEPTTIVIRRLLSAWEVTDAPTQP